MGEMLFQLLCSFFGTIAFSILYQVPRKYYISCGMTGTTGWMIYRVMVQGVTPAIASFFGVLVVVLMSRMLTVRMKCPITIFLVPGIIPLVPGAGIYFTAYYLVTNQLYLAAEKGIESVKIAFAIVLAIVFIVSIPREVFQPTYWKQRRLRKG
nr:threonine/serine exporter family protein [Faecalicatena contorta]